MCPWRKVDKDTFVLEETSEIRREKLSILKQSLEGLKQELENKPSKREIIAKLRACETLQEMIAYMDSLRIFLVLPLEISELEALIAELEAL